MLHHHLTNETVPRAKVPSKKQQQTTAIRIGVGGWSYAPWRDNFYPADLPQRRELEFASRQLTAIEINSTFYGAQKPATYAKWRSETPEGFVFSLKAPRYATAGKVLASGAKYARGFVEGGLAELGDKLGPISWQFAPTRAFDRDDLAAFLDTLPRELNGVLLRHVLEVRHPSFMQPDYLALTREHRVPTVFTDSPEYPSFADISGDFIYARLMRSEPNVASGYPARQLKAWAKHASEWAAGGDPADLPRVGTSTAVKSKKSRDVFIYFISAAKERNPAAALSLIQLLST